MEHDNVVDGVPGNVPGGAGPLTNCLREARDISRDVVRDLGRVRGVRLAPACAWLALRRAPRALPRPTHPLPGSPPVGH